ncbi:MAG: hypothetical protein QM805_07825 [Pseudomonas sp.]
MMHVIGKRHFRSKAVHFFQKYEPENDALLLWASASDNTGQPHSSSVATLRASDLSASPHMQDILAAQFNKLGEEAMDVVAVFDALEV